MNKFLSKLIPFIFLGIVLVALFMGIILFSYLLIFGAIVGLVLFLIQWFRMKFFPPKHLKKYKGPGRTFDHRE